MSKTASVHVGYGEGKHDYVAPAKEGFGARGSTLRGRSERPERVKRYEDGVSEAVAHHKRVKECEAPAHGITTPCRGRLQHSHRIGKGLGGGKDYAASDGECDMLCEQHHIEIDTRRAEMRAAGLSKRAPIPDKVVPRRIRKWD
mgnify:CR=1 FL=1|jgi:hypothetical protein